MIVHYFSVDANILLREIEADGQMMPEPTPYELDFERGAKAAAGAAADYCLGRFTMVEKSDDAAVFTSHPEYDIQKTILKKFFPDK